MSVNEINETNLTCEVTGCVQNESITKAAKYLKTKEDFISLTTEITQTLTLCLAVRLEM